MRRKPPTTRKSITHRFEILAKDGPIKGYITIGLFADGTPAEMFLVLARAGESIRGLARCWATCFSLCLQSGISLDHLVEKFKYFRFEPAGFTQNPDIPNAQSIADYVARWMEITFLKSGGDGNPRPTERRTRLRSVVSRKLPRHSLALPKGSNDNAARAGDDGDVVEGRREP